MLFDGICNLQAVAVDASRGNYGNCENYGNKLGRHEIPRGFAGVAVARGCQYYTCGNPTSHKTTVQVQYRHTDTRATGSKEGVWGRTLRRHDAIVAPGCGKPRRSFLQIFPQKSGEICKNTLTHLLHRHTHTAGTKSDAPGRTGRRGCRGLRKPPEKSPRA